MTGLILTPMTVSWTSERPGVSGPLREHARGVFGPAYDGATDRGTDVSDPGVDMPGG